MTAKITDRPLIVQPSLPFDQETADEVCRRVSQGEALRRVCDDDHMPSADTIYRWLADSQPFRDAYARARVAQMQGWADDVIEIADDTTGDWIDRVRPDGTTERVVDPETVQRSKLRMDARKWLMAKLAPHVYGDKVAVEVAGSVKVSAMSDAELESALAANLARLGVEVAGPLLLRGPDTDDTDDSTN